MNVIYTLLLLCILNSTYYVFCLRNGRSNRKNEEKKLLSFTQNSESFVKSSYNWFSNFFSGTHKNPWEGYMNLFDIQSNHGSGVKIDLGGIAQKDDKTYRYSTGMCPVFSKEINVTKKTNFLEKMNKQTLTEEKFLADMISGNVEDNGIQFPTVSEDKKYNIWISPVMKDSIYECAKYVEQFEHLIESKKENTNCVFENKGKCLKQSFIYDLKTHLCYILYPTLQSKANDTSNDFYYQPKKVSSSSFVFGSTNIVQNWETKCPKKPVKDAQFGKWDEKKGECKILTEEKIKQGTTVESVDDCGSKLFDLSSADNEEKTNGAGFNWANWDNTEKKCYIYKTKPNCLLNKKDSYALTSIGMINSEIYDLPECNSKSNGWKIKAKCEINEAEKDYTCDGSQWVSGTIKINECLSSNLWANRENTQPIENPWENYMSKFDIKKIHGSGVFVDLGGTIVVPHAEEKEKFVKYRYPTGKCPVFQKIIKLSDERNFLHVLTVSSLKINQILDAAIDGKMPTKINQSVIFKETNKSSIYDCATTAANFQNNIDQQKLDCTAKPINCIKFPFAYNLETKECYLLINPFQKSELLTSSFTFHPEKDVNSPIVFGSSTIESNWMDNCPIKPVAGVEFGHWNVNRCEKFSKVNVKDINNANNKAKCAKFLFDNSATDYPITNDESHGSGYNLASYNSETHCILHNKKSNCFINVKNSIAFASTAINNPDVHDLPPCISASEGWIVEAKCNNENKIKSYVCKNNKWFDENANAIDNCSSALYNWANINFKEQISSQDNKEVISPSLPSSINQNEPEKLVDQLDKQIKEKIIEIAEEKVIEIADATEDKTKQVVQNILDSEETSKTIKEKVMQAAETEEEKLTRQTENVIRNQLDQATNELNQQKIEFKNEINEAESKASQELLNDAEKIKNNLIKNLQDSNNSLLTKNNTTSPAGKYSLPLEVIGITYMLVVATFLF